MKKKLLTLLVTGGLLVSLAGCGANFKLSSTELNKYATDNGGQFSDITSTYSSLGYVQGCYAAEVSDVHLELWDIDTKENAMNWFNDNKSKLKEDSSLSINSSSNTGADSSFTVCEKNYRLLACNDIGVLAESTNKDSISNVLKGLGVIK